MGRALTAASSALRDSWSADLVGRPTEPAIRHTNPTQPYTPIWPGVWGGVEGQELVSSCLFLASLSPLSLDSLWTERVATPATRANPRRRCLGSGVQGRGLGFRSEGFGVGFDRSLLHSMKHLFDQSGGRCRGWSQSTPPSRHSITPPPALSPSLPSPSPSLSLSLSVSLSLSLSLSPQHQEPLSMKHLLEWGGGGLGVWSVGFRVQGAG